MKEQMMTQRFAILETNSGYVWGVVDAETAIEACTVVDAEIGASHDGEGRYEAISVSEMHSSGGAYDVRLAPAGFDVANGQDADEIDRVDALPRAGLFAFVRA